MKLTAQVSGGYQTDAPCKKTGKGVFVIQLPEWKKTISDSTSTLSSVNSTESTIGLQKNLGLFSGVALIVGTMIGSGIFVSPKGVLEGTGSVGMSLIVWACCGLLATLGALTYAELGTSIPTSGSEHAYLMKTFKPMNACWGPIPAFVYDWLGVLVLRPSMFAIMSLSLGTYAVKPFYVDCESPVYMTKLVTVCSMLLIAAINCCSVKMATIIQNLATLVKLQAIGLIAIVGIYRVCTGNLSFLSEGFQGTTTEFTTISLAFYNGLWAYDGWNNLNFVTEELKNPKRNLPLSIGIGIPLTTICYILVNIGYFSVLSTAELLSTDAVAMVWSMQIVGKLAWFMPIFVALSCFGAANGSLFASGRLCYVAARDGHLPAVLSYIHITKNTPVPSLLFTTLVGIMLILPSDLSQLIGFFGFTAWIFYGLTAASLIVLRFVKPDMERPYKVPMLIPALVILASLFLVLTPIITDPRYEYLYAVLFTCSGILVYFPTVYYRRYLTFLDKPTEVLTGLIQKLLLILPPDTANKSQ